MSDHRDPDPDDLAELAATNIVTSRFYGFTGEMGVAVQIALRPPRYWRRDQHEMLEKMPELAPERATWKLPGREQRAAYRRLLDTRAAAAFARLADIARAHLGERLCLLCYEDLAKEGCHRTWFSKWANERYGLNIPELDRNAALTGSGATRPAGKKGSLARRAGATRAAAQANRPAAHPRREVRGCETSRQGGSCRARGSCSAARPQTRLRGREPAVAR